MLEGAPLAVEPGELGHGQNMVDHHASVTLFLEVLNGGQSSKNTLGST